MHSGTALAAEFSQHINETGMRRPLAHRGPTPMLPPTAVVAAQMDALQMNDWPEPDSGVRTAFLFSKPFECESMIAGRVGLAHSLLFCYLLMWESHNAQPLEKTSVVEVEVL